MPNTSLIGFVDSILDTYQPALSFKTFTATYPALNIQESDSNFVVSVACPGINPEDLKLDLTQDILTVIYDHQDSLESSSRFLRQEYKHLSFKRTVSLPKSIDSTAIQADSKNGILTITIPKLPESKPKPITINIS